MGGGWYVGRWCGCGRGRVLDTLETMDLKFGRTASPRVESLLAGALGEPLSMFIFTNPKPPPLRASGTPTPALVTDLNGKTYRRK